MSRMVGLKRDRPNPFRETKSLVANGDSKTSFSLFNIGHPDDHKRTIRDSSVDGKSKNWAASLPLELH